MREILLTNGVQSVRLIRDLEFTISQEIVGSTATMASGRVVADVVGIKTRLDIPVGYLSREDISLLRSMINAGGVLTVTYPDVEGDVTAEFFVSPITLKSFKYGDDGVQVWYGFSLSCEGVEVTRA